jgi:hypothetical protein
MKTLEQVVTLKKEATLDFRDINRLIQFLDIEQIIALASSVGFFVNIENLKEHVQIPFTRENVLLQLDKDVAFGFEKALNRRGISSSLMYEVVQMWNWILEEGLESFTDYAQYGLPLFKATAEKYGFQNPIGSDYGDEDKYSEDAEW